MTIKAISLDKLVPSPNNVRFDAAKDGIAALAHSIDRLGLLNNLHVTRADNGTFAVIAGGRRLAALKHLVAERKIKKTMLVSCQVIDGQQATDVSFTENLMRLPMHEADQIMAFKKLADEGKATKEIALAYCITERHVKECLKLAAVSPRLLDAFRKDEMGVDELAAFTVSDDHTAQEQVWDELPDYNRQPRTIRRLLMKERMEADDPRVTFVGLAAYKKAGGCIVRDLFQPEHKGYLTEPAIIERLVAVKLEQAAAEHATKGWKSVEIVPVLTYESLDNYARLHPANRPLTAKQQARLDALSKQHDKLVEEHEDGEDEKALQRIDDLANKIDAITNGSHYWPDEVKARASVVVGIGQDGTLRVEEGLVPKDEYRAQKRAEDKAKSSAEGSPSSGLSKPIVEKLTMHKTSALRLKLQANEDAALELLVETLLRDTFYEDAAATCLEVTVTHDRLRKGGEDVAGSLAMRAMEARHEAIRSKLPENPGDLAAWLHALETTDQLKLLAYCVSLGVSAVQKPHMNGTEAELASANSVAEAVDLDMACYWTPTVASYFGSVPKKAVLDAVSEAVSADTANNLVKLKKGALDLEAEKRLEGVRWLPSVLRTKSGKPIADAPEIPVVLAAE